MCRSGANDAMCKPQHWQRQRELVILSRVLMMQFGKQTGCTNSGKPFEARYLLSSCFLPPQQREGEGGGDVNLPLPSGSKGAAGGIE